MIQYGEPPYLECSSKGNHKLSAFYARIGKRAYNSIEDLYQAHKVFEDGSTGLTWRQAKGKRALNQEDCNKFYSQLWDEYIKENPHLLDVLVKASGLSDIFGQQRHCCQVTELWRIRNEFLSQQKRPSNTI